MRSFRRDFLFLVLDSIIDEPLPLTTTITVLISTFFSLFFCSLCSMVVRQHPWVVEKNHQWCGGATQCMAWLHDHDRQCRASGIVTARWNALRALEICSRTTSPVPGCHELPKLWPEYGIHTSRVQSTAARGNRKHLLKSDTEALSVALLCLRSPKMAMAAASASKMATKTGCQGAARIDFFYDVARCGGSIVGPYVVQQSYNCTAVGSRTAYTMMRMLTGNVFAVYQGFVSCTGAAR